MGSIIVFSKREGRKPVYFCKYADGVPVVANDENFSDAMVFDNVEVARRVAKDCSDTFGREFHAYDCAKPKAPKHETPKREDPFDEFLKLFASLTLDAMYRREMEVSEHGKNPAD